MGKWDKRIEATEECKRSKEQKGEERGEKKGILGGFFGKMKKGTGKAKPDGHCRAAGVWGRSGGCLTVELICLLNLEQGCSNQETWEWA